METKPKKISAMSTELARQARANALWHDSAMELDPAFEADAKKYGSIYTRDWAWSVLFDAATSAVKQRLFELDALAPGLMDDMVHAHFGFT